MRYTKFIALLATMFVAVSCVTNDLDFDDSYTDTASDVVTVYGNIARFADCEVSTRANKTPEESYVSRMALAVFPIINEETGETGDCIHYELRDGSNLLYTVDRAEIRKNYPNDDGEGSRYDDQPCVMYIFANMPGLEATYTGSADDLLNRALANPGLIRPDDGFPMIGSLGDKDRDGKEFVLIPMSGNRLDLPTVDGTPTDYLNIPMSAIFAKISFEIAVSPDQDIDVHAPARFEMTGYEVHNLPSSVSFNEDNNKEGELDENGEAKQKVNGEPTSVAMTGIAQGGNEGSGSIIEFDFYLPERLLTPDTSAESYEYPLGENGAKVVGYNDIPNENKKYAQRYKPKLLGEGQKATFVRIKGKYRDHQEYYHDVSYDIYLGADNYGDFNIKRNNQYYNKLNIKGITSSDDQAVNPNAISIDWRVNVERSSPLIISLRRETQLDAHYEVRPLRLRIAGGSGATVPEGAKVEVEVLNVDGTEINRPDWVRLEKSVTTGTNHITDDPNSSSYGKRKYFTTNLVTETLVANTKIEVTKPELSTTDNATVWIYVDEADPNEATPTRTTRSAIIRVTYTDNELIKEGKNDVKDFHLSQYNLHKIQGKANPEPYFIECFEEYLYNYDAEDNYGQIREEGMPWGLNGAQLSNKYYSFDPNLTPNVNWGTYETGTGTKRPYYDFYTKKHDSFAVDNGGTVREYPGQAFTKEIAENPNSGIKYRELSEQAESAVEYCYNRNKRNEDGTIDVVWYLPSADELEDFIVPAYNYYEEFQKNFYWTSQPAYIRNIFYYQYDGILGWGKDVKAIPVYDDNLNYARATKVIGIDDEPVKSGLVREPTPYENNTPDGYTNLGWFYQMHYWKGRNDYGVVKKDVLPNGDERYTHNGSYYIHLGHLDDVIDRTVNNETGYLHRNESHRVRCVRKVTQNQQ